MSRFRLFNLSARGDILFVVCYNEMLSQIYTLTAVIETAGNRSLIGMSLRYGFHLRRAGDLITYIQNCAFFTLIFQLEPGKTLYAFEKEP